MWLEQHHAGQEDEVAGLLAHHWLGAEDEAKAIRYLTTAGDRARQEYALDEAIAYYRELLPLLDRRGEDREMALVLFKLALALHVSLRFAEANETYQRAFECWAPPDDAIAVPVGHAPRRDELPARRPRPAVRDRVAEHPAVHAAVRSPGGAVARAHDRAVARRTLGDLRRRPALRVPPARRAHVVRRTTAHGARRGVRHQARAEPGGPRILGRDLLRDRRRPGVLPGRGGRRLDDRRARAGRPHGGVPARRTGAVLHERHEPARRWPAAPPRHRGARRRMDRAWEAGRLGRLRRRRAIRGRALARAARRSQRRSRRERGRGGVRAGRHRRGARRRTSATSSTSSWLGTHRVSPT